MLGARPERAEISVRIDQEQVSVLPGLVGIALREGDAGACSQWQQTRLPACAAGTVSRRTMADGCNAPSF